MISLKGNIVSGGKVVESAIGISDGFVTPPGGEILDFSDHYIMPAFIELHAHGGGGYDFIDNTPESFKAIFYTHLSHGVATLCPTLCACDFDEMLRFLEFCRKTDEPGFAGVHLEGPFLSPEMCGAQNLSCIIEPTSGRIEALSDYSDVIARITAAPEVDGVYRLADSLHEKCVRFSVGHSNADSAAVRESFSHGFDSVTHLFCSTSGRHKLGSFVHGGVIEEALLSDCFVELIGDGHHVSRESLLLTLKCKGTDHVCIVSDAMRAAGTSGQTESFLGAAKPENRVIIEDGVAKLPDRSSFAGSLAVGDTMVKALVGYGIGLPVISEMMSGTPARLLGLSDRGGLGIGMRADITVLDRNFETVLVFRKGEIVYKNENLIRDRRL